MSTRATDEITTGSRVICHKHGPHDGSRGRVVEVVGEWVHVEFPTSSMVARLSYFEKV